MMQQKVILTNPYENCGLRKKNDDFCEYSAAAPSQCWICLSPSVTCGSDASVWGT